MKKINIFIVIVFCAMLGACSNDDELFGEEKESAILPGTYSADLMLAAEGSRDVNMITRGGPDESGKFTEYYPYNYIYLHRADNLTGNEHQVIRIPLKDVEFCDGCQGIHLEMTVLEDSEGYTVANEAGDKISLAADDEVYFSTVPDTYWKPNIIEDSGSPVSSRDVFYQDDEVNKELLRSSQNYSMEELLALLQEESPHIDMERHCTAFKTFLMFTDVKGGEDGFYNVTTSQWKEALGHDVEPQDFYIKLYLGPNFTDSYNVYGDNTDDASGGFYVTNNQQYVPFSNSRSGYTGEIDSDGDGILDQYVDYSYRGYGYQTQAGNYLISPLNTNIPVDSFSIYVFVKYTRDIDAESNDFLTSDVGAKWFKVQVPRMTLETNTVHWITLAFDVDNLKVFTEDAVQTQLTRMFMAPQRMELKHPYKVIDVPGE